MVLGFDNFVVSFDNIVVSFQYEGTPAISTQQVIISGYLFLFHKKYP